MDGLTLIIGAHLNHYTIVAADTRTDAHPPDIRNVHCDGNHKIAIFRDGLLAASGYPGILNLFKKELLKHETITTSKVKEIIAHTLLPQMESYRKLFPHLEDNTGFLISRIPDPLAKDPFPALYLINERGRIKEGVANDNILVLPADMNRQIGKRCQEYLRENLVAYAGLESESGYFDELLSNLRRNLIVISNCFEWMAGISSQVSRDIDIAVLHLSGDVFYGCGLSAVISRGALRQMLLIQDHTITRYLTPELCGGDSAVHVMLEST